MLRLSCPKVGKYSLFPGGKVENCKTKGPPGKASAFPESRMKHSVAVIQREDARSHQTRSHMGTQGTVNDAFNQGFRLGKSGE